MKASLVNNLLTGLVQSDDMEVKGRTGDFAHRIKSVELVDGVVYINFDPQREIIPHVHRYGTKTTK